MWAIRSDEIRMSMRRRTIAIALRLTSNASQPEKAPPSHSNPLETRLALPSSSKEQAEDTAESCCDL